MPVDLSVQILNRRLDRAVARAPREVTAEVKKAFRVILFGFHREFSREKLRKAGDPRSRERPPRPGLHRRTGALARGFNVDLRGETLNQLTGRIGWFDRTGAMIATVHERGATITGRPWLTVPLRDAMTPAGVLRFPSARDYPNTFIQRNRSGRLFIMQKQGRRIRALFRLARSVRIPARLQFRKTWDEGVRERVRILNDAITRGVRRAEGN